MTTTTHPMADKPIGQLLRQFAVPSIIAMLVSSLYNIIDQLFIGQSIGLLGNAATNIAFPLTPTCVAFSLMFGIGGAAVLIWLWEPDEKKKPLPIWATHF